MKNILVLIDNSINSDHLALSAMNIALNIKANISLVHATKRKSSDDDLGPVDELQIIEKEGLEAIAEKIRNMVSKSRNSGSAIAIQLQIHNGSLIDLLKEQTGDGVVDLVIIGSHQSSAWENLMSKTQIQVILETIGCPLLIVPKKFVVKEIHQTIFAVDLTNGYKKSLQYIVAFSATFGANVLVNHISKLGFPEKPSEEDLYNKVNLNLDHNFPPVTFHSIRSADVKAALLETMETGKVDLLCIVHKKYGFLAGIFHTSISKQLAGDSKVPIMILQETY